MSAEKINKRPCTAMISRRGVGKPCPNWAITPKKLIEWRKTGRITAEQLSLATATRPLCHKHMPIFLGDMYGRDVKAKIIGDSFKGLRCNPGAGLRVLEAMRRAGLLHPRGAPRPTPLQQCVASCRKTGLRCKNWRHPGGARTCRYHGGRGLLVMAAMHKAGLGTPEAEAIRANAKKLTQERQLRRKQRRLERQQRKVSGMLPHSIGFRPDTQPERTLEDEFKSGRGPANKPLKPLY